MQSIIIAGLAAFAAAAPLERRQGVNDGVILNYALTLEHLENAFYHQGLANYTEEDFRKAGAHPNFYYNLKEISKDEETHVSFLSGALQAAGVTPVQPSTYAFGATTAAQFLAVANVLEGVGVSAYLGAAQYISNKAYLTAAGSILTVEARHSAFLRENQSPAQSPFPAAFDIPLDFDEVYSLAALFITSSPASNPALPVTAFPSISASPAGVAKIGDKIELTISQSVGAQAAYFITSTGPVSAELSGSGSSYCVTIPAGAQAGQAYLVLTSEAASPTDDNIVAGPAVIQVADNAYGQTEGGNWHQGGHGGWNGHN